MKKNKKAFTLIELLVAIAIVGILAAVVLVSMSSYAKKARSAKALAQLSSMIPSMYSCWGNATIADAVNTPLSGGDICKISSSYGKWPQIAGDLSSYKYDGSSIDNTNKKFAILFTSGSSDDDKEICCNSAMNSCKILDAVGETCSETEPGF